MRVPLRCEPEELRVAITDAQAEHSRPWRWNIQPFAGRQWIHQNQARDSIGILRCIGAHEHPTKRMAYQNERRRNSCAVKQRVQFVYDDPSDSRRPRSLAPTQPGAIIRACTGKALRLGANLRPIKTCGGNPRFKDNRRAVGASVDQMQASSADVDHSSRRRIAATVGQQSRCLVDESRKDENRDDGENRK
jgi:hypothetical protein